MTALLVTCVVGGAATSLSGEVLPSELVKHLPGTANAVMLIDFEAVEQNPWAQSNQLQARDVVAAPEGVRQLMLGAQVDFEYLAPTWQVAFVTFAGDYKLSDLTSGDLTKLETIAEKPVVWLDDQSAAVALSGSTFGLAGPISRAFAAEWVRRDLAGLPSAVAAPEAGHAGDPARPADAANATDAGNVPDQPEAAPVARPRDLAVSAKEPSIFLRFAGQTIEDKHNVLVMAVDFRGALRPETARRIVEFSQLFPEEELERATELLASIEGAMLTVRATDQLTGRLQVRFGQDAEVLAKRGPALVDNILTNIGARIPEIATWQTTVEENVLTLSGPLSVHGLDRLGSLAVFDPSTPQRLRRFASAVRSGAQVAAANAAPERVPSDAPLPYPPENVPAGTDPAAGTRIATIDHLQRARRILGVLQRESDNATWFESRFWLDRSATRLEYLNQQNVDPELLSLTESIAYRLRDMANQLEDAGLQSARQLLDTGWVNTPTWSTVNVGGIRYRHLALYYAGGESPLIDRIEANITMRDAYESARSIGRSILADLNTTGANLAQKYDFQYVPWQPRGWDE